MKLVSLIAKLSKAHNDYRLRYGKEPIIWDWTDGTLALCAKVTSRAPGIQAAEKPVKHYRIKPPWEHT